MDNNKIKKKIKIKPTHFISVGWFLTTLAFTCDYLFNKDIISAICVLGLSFFMYGIGFAVVKDITS